jgi:hypothetical protein
VGARGGGNAFLWDGFDRTMPAAASHKPDTAAGGARHHGVNARESWVSPLAGAWLLAAAATSVFLAGGPQQGALGIFLAAAGVALVLCPPQVKVDWRLWAASAGLILCASLAFLPAHWFPVPAWRTGLEALPAIPMPTMITPVPWQTAFWLALLASAALIGLFLLAQPLRSSALLSLAAAATAVCGLYSALSIYAKVTGWHYPFAGDATFGFFPNRNHSATFLITGSILAMGVLGSALRESRWLAAGVAAASLTASMTGLLVYSGSRGGVIFLLAGTLIWIAGLGRANRDGRLLISCVTLLLAAGLFFLLSGGEARTRMAAWFQVRPPPPVGRANLLPGAIAPTGNAPADAGDTPFDERVLIYKDTLPLIGAFPLTGIGLGAFRMVFPQYRNASVSETPAAHPESDWLMLAAEAGIPATACVLALAWLLAGRLPPLKDHPYWPVRWGFVAAVAAAALHGLVDVPAHRVSLGWWMLILAGLGLQPGRVKTPLRSRTQRAMFAAGGIAMFVLGAQLIRAEWFGGAPLPPFAADWMEPQITRAYAQHDLEKAGRINRQAIFALPLEQTFYYQWGALELPFADSDAEVKAAFRAERLLEPGSPVVPLIQGEAWIHYDAGQTVSLWLDALGRQQRVDRAGGVGAAAEVGFFRDLLARSAKWPDVQRGLLAGAEDRPVFALAWLESARPELVYEQVNRFAGDHGFVTGLDADERRRFLRVWYAVGDREKLAQFIAGHPSWEAAAWPIRLRHWIEAREFERAVHEAAAHYKIALTLPPPRPEDGTGGAPAQEPADAVAAFDAYWSSGNTVAARRILEEATAGGTHPIPSEIWRLKAALAARDADWAAAWGGLGHLIGMDGSDIP